MPPPFPLQGRRCVRLHQQHPALPGRERHLPQHQHHGGQPRHLPGLHPPGMPKGTPPPHSGKGRSRAGGGEGSPGSPPARADAPSLPLQQVNFVIDRSDVPLDRTNSSLQSECVCWGRRGSLLHPQPGFWGGSGGFEMLGRTLRCSGSGTVKPCPAAAAGGPCTEPPIPADIGPLLGGTITSGIRSSVDEALGSLQSLLGGTAPGLRAGNSGHGRVRTGRLSPRCLPSAGDAGGRFGHHQRHPGAPRGAAGQLQPAAGQPAGEPRADPEALRAALRQRLAGRRHLHSQLQHGEDGTGVPVSVPPPPPQPMSPRRRHRKLFPADPQRGAAAGGAGGGAGLRPRG